MKLSIIGAGRVGQTLGLLANQAGIAVTDVISRSLPSARAAVRFIGGGNPQSVSQARLSPVDLLLIATPDEQITNAVAFIGSQLQIDPRTVVLHTSGAVSSSALASLTTQVAGIGSCHPLQTFAQPSQDLSRLRQTYFCIEGTRRGKQVARQLVRAIGAPHFEIATEMKSLYHAAAVMASGGVTALLSICIELLHKAGLGQQAARRALLPLTEGTLANVRALGAPHALTGPVKRGEAETVALNLRALQSMKEDWATLYRLLAERGLRLAAQAGTEEDALRRVRLALHRTKRRKSL